MSQVMSDLSIAILVTAALATLLILGMKKLGTWADRKYEELKHKH